MSGGGAVQQGYRGLQAGRRVVVPGLANKIVVAMTHLLPRRWMLELSDARNRVEY